VTTNGYETGADRLPPCIPRQARLRSPEDRDQPWRRRRNRTHAPQLRACGRAPRGTGAYRSQPRL